MIANMLDLLINRLPRWELAAAISTMLLIMTLVCYAAYRWVGAPKLKQSWLTTSADPSSRQPFICGRAQHRLWPPRRRTGSRGSAVSCWPWSAAPCAVPVPADRRGRADVLLQRQLADVPTPACRCAGTRSFFGDPRWYAPPARRRWSRWPRASRRWSWQHRRLRPGARGPFAAVRCSRATSSRLILPPDHGGRALHLLCPDRAARHHPRADHRAHDPDGAYVVLLMSVAIRQFDVRIEQVAYSLGASWLRMFKSVLLPNLPPSVLAA